MMKKNRIYIFDKYAVWNLIFAIVAILTFIFAMCYVGLYNKDKTFIEQFGGTWFYMTLGFGCSMLMVLFIVNLYYSIKKLILASRQDSTKSKVFYSLGIIIPFIGMAYDLIDRKTLIQISNKLEGKQYH